MKSSATLLALILIAAATTLRAAETPQDAAMPMRTNAPSVASQTNEEQRMVSPTMEHMARSMTSMSEMCKMMMQMEMKSHPLKVAAFAAGGTLLSIALILLIILELQWIRYFSLRIRSEKTRPQMP